MPILKIKVQAIKSLQKLVSNNVDFFHCRWRRKHFRFWNLTFPPPCFFHSLHASTCSQNPRQQKKKNSQTIPNSFMPKKNPTAQVIAASRIFHLFVNLNPRNIHKISAFHWKEKKPNDDNKKKTNYLIHFLLLYSEITRPIKEYICTQQASSSDSQEEKKTFLFLSLMSSSSSSLSCGAWREELDGKQQQQSRKRERERASESLWRNRV